MEQEHTLRILNALANGIHPSTGEQFGADSPYQHPDTVRALFDAMRAIESARTPVAAPAQKAATLPGNSGVRWTTEEDERLAAEFDGGGSVDALARSHDRSRASIEARLVKLGKMDASAITTPLRYPARPPGHPSRTK